MECWGFELINCGKKMSLLELNPNPNRYLKRFDALVSTNKRKGNGQRELQEEAGKSKKKQV